MPEITHRPDEFFAVEHPYSLSYRFVDKEKKPIPNEFGWSVIRFLKSSCVHNGHAVIAHTDVNPILAEYGRDELAAILEQNGEPWIPYAKRPRPNQKAAQSSSKASEESSGSAE